MMSLRVARMNRCVVGALGLLGLVALASLVMVHDARSQIQDKDERARKCYQNAESLNAKLHVSMGKVKELQDSLKEEMDTRKEDGAKLRRQVEELKALRAQDKTDRESFVERHEKTIATMKGQIKELQDEFSRQVETNQNLLKEKNEYATRMDEAVKELEKYKSQAADLNTQMKQQISELKVELKNGGDCKVHVLKLKEELSEAKSRLENCVAEAKGGAALQNAVTKAPLKRDKNRARAAKAVGANKPGDLEDGEGVLQPPPDGNAGADADGKKSLAAPDVVNHAELGKLSSPRTNKGGGEEGVGQKPPSEDEFVRKGSEKKDDNDVIQRPALDNAEEQEDDQGPAPALRLSNLGEEPAAHRSQLAFLHQREAAGARDVAPELAVVRRPDHNGAAKVPGAAWRGGGFGPRPGNADVRIPVPIVGGRPPPQLRRRAGWRRGPAAAGADNELGAAAAPPHNVQSNNYADFDDGESNRHNFDQIGDGDVAADRLKQRYNDYLGENNQEEGDDAVDGQIPVIGVDDGKDDNILPAPPLEQNGNGRVRRPAPNQPKSRQRFGRSRREPGEVFVVSGNDGEEGVVVNPH